MTGTEVIQEVDIAGFYVEVMHMRGNFSKFEFLPYSDDPDGTEPEELNVWDFRRRSHEDWHLGFALSESMRLRGGEIPKFRVTRYPALEQDVLDTTYHPSVDSQHIDIERVKEHYTNGS